MSSWSDDRATEFPRHDRHWVLSAGTSLLLHGAALALLIVAWRAAPKPTADLQPIPVTLVKAEAAAPVAQPSIAPVDSAMTGSAAPPRVAPPTKTAAAKSLASKSAHMTQPKPRPAQPPPRAAAIPGAPNDGITALLQEGVAGRPLTGAGAGQSGIALRSSAPVSDDYLVVLQDWLARFQRYPDAAKAKHEEGSGVVGFTLTRDGRVEKVWMDQSTGTPSLDNATMAMVEAASPVPPLPKGFAGATLDLFLPINYTLSTYERLFQ